MITLKVIKAIYAQKVETLNNFELVNILHLKNNIITLILRVFSCFSFSVLAVF